MSAVLEALTPAFFEAAGQTPEASIILAQQANDPAARAGLMHPTPISATAVAGPAMSIESAQSELSQLQADRSAGLTNDAQWNAQSARRDELVRAITQQTSPGNGKLTGSLAVTFPPTQSEFDYAVIDGDDTPEGQAATSAVAQGMHAEGVPKTLGDAMFRDIARVTKTVTTPEQAEAVLQHNTQQLFAMWGARFNEHSATLSAFLNKMGRAFPAMDSALKAVKYADPLTIDSALQFARAKAGQIS